MGTTVSNITRNLRDGQLTIRDGSGTPKTITVALDQGNLSWTERKEVLEVKDRGVYDHTREGDQHALTMQFGAKWTQLLGKNAAAGNALQLYEFLRALSGTGVVSTSGAGQAFTLDFLFQVNDPNTTNANNELITFTKVRQVSLDMREGDQFNVLNYTGRSIIPVPTITRP